MTETHLLAELQESRAEIQRLRDRISTRTPTIHKDLSLISLVPKWSGLESAVSLEEFISSIEGAAKIGRWQDSDCVQIAVLKLIDLTKSFYNACQDLHTEDTIWQKFKEVFQQRFKDICTDQYHYMKLQTARQSRNEDPRHSLTGAMNYHRKSRVNLAIL
jgi:hypothetical protein